MKKLINILAISGAILALTACGAEENYEPTITHEHNHEHTHSHEHDHDDHSHDHDHDDHSHDHNHDHDHIEPIQVVATFTIIADMVYQIAGDLVEIYTIVPIGEDPEEHEILPSNLTAVSNADIIFYNGLNLEEGDEWFEILMASTDRITDVHYFRVSEGVTPFNLLTEGMEDYYDPHAWLDIRNGIIYIQNIAAFLSNLAPEHTDTFNANAENLITSLNALHNEWVGRFDDIPSEQRIVITAEGAFRYFSYAYNVYTAYIWELNAEEEGTPQQMIDIITFVNNSEVPVLFTESSVDTHYIEQVSEETGVPIFAMLYTDSLSEANGNAPTYYLMMRFNLETIYAGLTSAN